MLLPVSLSPSWPVLPVSGDADDVPQVDVSDFLESGREDQKKKKIRRSVGRTGAGKKGGAERSQQRNLIFFLSHQPPCPMHDGFASREKERSEIALSRMGYNKQSAISLTESRMRHPSVPIFLKVYFIWGDFCGVVCLQLRASADSFLVLE